MQVRSNKNKKKQFEMPYSPTGTNRRKELSFNSDFIDRDKHMSFKDKPPLNPIKMSMESTR